MLLWSRPSRGTLRFSESAVNEPAIMQAAGVRYSHPYDNMFSAFCHLFFMFFAKNILNNDQKIDQKRLNNEKLPLVKGTQRVKKAMAVF